MMSVHFVRESNVVWLVARILWLTYILTFIQHVFVLKPIPVLGLFVN